MPTPSRNSGLLVLGMHRSGTSAVTGVLRLLGAGLGDKMVPAEENINPKGYWENLEINEFHERLLQHLESGWFDALAFPDDWLHAEDTTQFYEELTAIIERNFGVLPLWAVKDPRLCRFVALWRQVLAETNHDVSCLLMLRHPSEVAFSLMQRDGIQRPHALLLWLRYVLDSERDSRGLRRVIVTYEELLNDWRTTMELVDKALQVGLTIYHDDAAALVDNYLDAQLRHHTTPSQLADDPLLRLATDAYHAVRTDDVYALDHIRAQFENLVEQHFFWLMEAKYVMRAAASHKKAIAQAETQIATLTGTVEGLSDEIKRVKASLSWQVTKPLRAIQMLITKLARR